MSENHSVIFLKPCELAVISTVGPFRDSENEAWAAMFNWLDKGGHHEPNGLGMGFSYHNAADSSADLSRYSAGVKLPSSWSQSDWENLRRSHFNGGAYIVRRNVATYDHMASVISDIEQQWIPKVGLYFDRTRPVVSLYRHDPRTTNPEDRFADVCLPVSFDRRTKPRLA